MRPSSAVAEALRCVNWRDLTPTERDAVLRRPAQAAAPTTGPLVNDILQDVRQRGDVALRELGLRFDHVSLASFEVTPAEFASADNAVPSALRTAIEDAAQRVETYHRAGMLQPYAIDTADGVRCERILRPIRRAGLYVPAGGAPLPSTVIMLGVPARLAGCPEVVMCTPPRLDGTVDPAILFAARHCGIERVFKLGGAQAIAAMAHGTESVPRCDKVFGPGNDFVTEAKRQVSLRFGTAIDMPAGPSELLVVADAGANPRFVAADLLSQAEHGPDSQVLLLSDSDATIDGVVSELAIQLATLPRVAIAHQALRASCAIRVATLDPRHSRATCMAGQGGNCRIGVPG